MSDPIPAICSRFDCAHHPPDAKGFAVGVAVACCQPVEVVTVRTSGTIYRREICGAYEKQREADDGDS